MAITAKKLGQTALNVSGSVVTIVTGVTGGHTEITGLWLANTSSSSRTVTILAHGTGTTSTYMLIPAKVLAAYESLYIQMNGSPIILNATETLRGYQDTGTDVVVTAYGVEEV